MIGKPPIEYVAGWRLQIVKPSGCAPGTDSIARIAEAVGYESEAAFERQAFKTGAWA